MTFADLLQLRKGINGEVLKPRFFKYLLELNNKKEPRRHDVFHPSEISESFCAREWCLIQVYPDLYHSFIEPEIRFKFIVGKWMHKMVQDCLAEMGVLYGGYNCLGCGFDQRCTHTGFKPEGCKKSLKDAKPLWVYDEVHVVDNELNIQGNSDGIIVVKPYKFLFEFKSYKHEALMGLTEPFEKHKKQAMIYLSVLEKNRRIWLKGIDGTGIDPEVYDIEKLPFSGMLFWYLDKSEEDILEFVVYNKREEIDKYMNSLSADLKFALKCRDERILPPATCKNQTEAKRRKCKAYRQCLALRR